MSVRKPAPFLNYRSNEFPGDFAAWLKENSGDNEEQRERLLKNLRIARKSALTPRQQQMLGMYFDEGKTMVEIANQLHLNKSTVSRNIARGLHRLSRCLRYSF